ncbi:hypothetical protein POTOM_058227 [Populus tomentosa]|uniref:Chromo domain-containing protein n=1 Tax=Populus tomentosa TaxID=118781 RepID=A0A8X8C290_POPTO|nr:hypothetical protein POTOM_058227 [Populus tomentosa]
MGFSRIFLRNKTKEATPVEIVRETQRLLLCISSDHRLKQEEKKKTEADLKQEKKAAAALANNIRALKSIAYGNDESSAVSRACAQLTEEFFRENTLLLLIVCLPKMTSEAQRDATQVVANLLRHKVQSRLIASQYLEKNTDVLDLLVAGCGNMDMAIQYGEMLRACLRHQSAARYVLESPAHLKKFFDYIQLRYFDIASDVALTLKELLTRHTYSLVPEFLSKNYEWFFADFNSKLLESSDYFTRMQATKLLGHMLLDHSNSDVMARYASSRNNLRIVMNLMQTKTQDFLRLQDQNTDQPQLQNQVDQIATMMEQLIHRLDLMEERCTREEQGPFNRSGRRATHRERLGDSDGDGYEEEGNQELENHEPRVRHHRRNMHRGHADHGTGYQPLDELTKRMRVDVPDFLGKLEPNAFEDWLTAIEDYFDWFAVSEDRKVRYVRMKLKGHARAWWGSVEEQLRRTHRPAICNWEEMKERLKEKYLPIDYEQMMFEEMLQLRQGSLSVDQFTDRFHELTVRSKVTETEQQTLARYRTGLRNDLRKEMWTARLINVEEAYQLALRIEKQLGSAAGRKMMSWDSKSEFVPTSSTQRLPPVREQIRSGVSGDYKGKAKASNEGPQCYKCKGFGHYAVVCPTRDKKLAFICERELLGEDTVDDTEEEEIVGSGLSDEEHLSASELPSCVSEFDTKKEVVPVLTMRQFSRIAEAENMVLLVVHREMKQEDTILPTDLPTEPSEAALDFSSYMRDVHEECKRRLTTHTNSYAAVANAKRKDRQFNTGDMVLVRLRPERFPPGSFSKLHARRAGPFQVTKKLGSNAYVIALPSDFGISPIFNIEDLTEFKGDVDNISALPTPTITPAPRVPAITTPRDEVAAILDHQFVTTRRGGYFKFLVQWKNRPRSDSVWLQASEIKRLHPHLFTAYTSQNLPESSSSGGLAREAPQTDRWHQNLLRDSSKCIRIKAFGVFKLFAANQNRSSDVITVLVANRSKLLRFLADFKTDKEDECFEADKAQVMKEIVALDPRDQSHE